MGATTPPRGGPWERTGGTDTPTLREGWAGCAVHLMTKSAGGTLAWRGIPFGPFYYLAAEMNPYYAPALIRLVAE